MIWGKGADLDVNAGPSKVMITMTQRHSRRGIAEIN